jgi:hypothetical protein
MIFVKAAELLSRRTVGKTTTLLGVWLSLLTAAPKQGICTRAGAIIRLRVTVKRDAAGVGFWWTKWLNFKFLPLIYFYQCSLCVNASSSGKQQAHYKP